jgi:hypothetical protein
MEPSLKTSAIHDIDEDIHLQVSPSQNLKRIYGQALIEDSSELNFVRLKQGTGLLKIER